MTRSMSVSRCLDRSATPGSTDTARDHGWREAGVRLAEGEGFDPLIPCGAVVFKTTAIDHSAIPPHGHFIQKPVDSVLDHGSIQAIVVLCRSPLDRRLF